MNNSEDAYNISTTSGINEPTKPIIFPSNLVTILTIIILYISVSFRYAKYHMHFLHETLLKPTVGLIKTAKDTFNKSSNINP